MAVTFALLTVVSNSSEPAAIKIKQEMLIVIYKAGNERIVLRLLMVNSEFFFGADH